MQPSYGPYKEKDVIICKWNSGFAERKLLNKGRPSTHRQLINDSKIQEVIMNTESKIEKRPKSPWNKGKMVGQKLPLKLKEIWAIRSNLQRNKKLRDLALFDLGIDSKLRGCDLVALHVRDISQGIQVSSRAIVMQRKTHRPVQFEITQPTRDAITAWIAYAHLRSDQYLFPSRLHGSPHISTRQYAKIVGQWVTSIGLDQSAYGTHTMRRTKATLIYRRTKNLRAVQLLLGHNKVESTVRYLGIEVDDALVISEQTDV
jgi:integrase